MVCGHDGWVGRWILVETATQSFLEWSNACQNTQQNWSYQTSEMFDIQLSPGEGIQLSLCADSACTQTVPYTELEVKVRVNGTMVGRVHAPENGWDFTHVCPL